MASSSKQARMEYPILDKLNQRKNQNGEDKYNADICAKIVKLLYAMHKSFDYINQSRDIASTFGQGTIRSFGDRTYLHTYIDTLGNNPTRKDIRDALLSKRLPRHNELPGREGLLCWIIEEGVKPQLAQIINPEDDVFRYWKEYIESENITSKPGKEDWANFLLTPHFQQNFEPEGEAGNIANANNTANKHAPTIKNIDPNANWWMLDGHLKNEDGTDSNWNNAPISVQIIGEQNDLLPDNDNITLMMRGSEVKLFTHEFSPSTNDVRHLKLSNCLLIPTPFSTPSIIGSKAIYSGYKSFEHDPDNSSRSVTDEPTISWRKIMNNALRTRYEHFGNHSNQKDKGFMCTPYTTENIAPKNKQPGGLICAVCYRLIKRKPAKKKTAKKSKGEKDWNQPTNTNFLNQEYDVDHIFNLLFNHFFGLNNSGLGFLNTCGKCNRSFKSEKLWAPSWDLWNELLKMSELSIQLYPPPLLSTPGYLQRVPYGGHKTFTLEPWYDQNSRDQSINFANQYHRYPDNEMLDPHSRSTILENSGLYHKDTSTYDNIIRDTENYQHIEEIIMDRLRILCDGTASRLGLIDDRNQSLITDCIHPQLQPKFDGQNNILPGTSYQPIIDRYVDEVEFFPFVTKMLSHIRERRTNLQNAMRNGANFKINPVLEAKMDIEDTLVEGNKNLESYEGSLEGSLKGSLRGSLEGTPLVVKDTTTPPLNTVNTPNIDLNKLRRKLTDAINKKKVDNKKDRARKTEQSVLREEVIERHKIANVLPPGLTGLRNRALPDINLITQLREQIKEQLVSGSLNNYAFGEDSQIPLLAIQPIIDWIHQQDGQMSTIILQELMMQDQILMTNTNTMETLMNEIGKLQNEENKNEEYYKGLLDDSERLTMEGRQTRRYHRILTVLLTNIVKKARRKSQKSAHSLHSSVSKSRSVSVSVPRGSLNSSIKFNTNLNAVNEGDGVGTTSLDAQARRRMGKHARQSNILHNNERHRVGKRKNNKEKKKNLDKKRKPNPNDTKITTTTATTGSSSVINQRMKECDRCPYNRQFPIPGKCPNCGHMHRFGGGTRKNRRRKNRTKRKKKNYKKNTKKHRRRKNRTRNRR